jgi:hypothetical protein
MPAMLARKQLTCIYINRTNIFRGKNKNTFIWILYNLTIYPVSKIVPSKSSSFKEYLYKPTRCTKLF